MPSDSNWNTPLASPRCSNSYVGRSSSGRFWTSSSSPRVRLISLSVFSIRVRVRSPRKSIFSRPTFSMIPISHWVVTTASPFCFSPSSPLRVGRWTGT